MKKIEQLEQIRQIIIQQVAPLMDDESLEPYDRFIILSKLAQSSGEVDYYTKAARIVPSIDSKQRQLSAYMTLLEDLEGELLNQIDDDTSSQQEDQPTTE